MTDLTPKSREVLDLLRQAAESDHTIAGVRWSQVYLDNAAPGDLTPRQFAGHLSALQKAGLYRPQGDDCFGDVKMDD